MFRQTIVLLAFLLLSAQRMPAPITVPPEEQAPVKVAPPEEKKSPTKTKKTSPKTAAEPNQFTVDGVWTGTLVGTGTQPGYSLNYSIQVSDNGKTVHTSWGDVVISRFHVVAQRSSNTMTWNIEFIATNPADTSWRSSCALTVTGSNTAKFTRTSDLLSGPFRGGRNIYSGTLRR